MDQAACPKVLRLVENTENSKKEPKKLLNYFIKYNVSSKLCKKVVQLKTLQNKSINQSIYIII